MSDSFVVPQCKAEALRENSGCHRQDTGGFHSVHELKAAPRKHQKKLFCQKFSLVLLPLPHRFSSCLHWSFVSWPDGFGLNFLKGRAISFGDDQNHGDVNKKWRFFSKLCSRYFHSPSYSLCDFPFRTEICMRISPLKSKSHKNEFSTQSSLLFYFSFMYFIDPLGENVSLFLTHLIRR